MIRSTAAVRRIAIGWQKLVAPNSTGTNKYQAYEAEIDNIYREIAAAPTSVSNIPWADFESKIEDKNAFKEIKAKHDAKVFPAPTPVVKMTETDYQNALNASKKEAAMYTTLITELESEAESILSTKQEWPLWTPQQHLDSVAGLEAEYDRLADDLLHFVPFEVEEALQAIDLQKSIIDKLEEGKVPTLDIASYDILPSESPVRIAIEKEYEAFANKVAANGGSLTPLSTLIAQARAASVVVAAA